MNGKRNKVFGKNRTSNTLIATALVTLLLSPIGVKAEEATPQEISDTELNLTVQTYNSVPLTLGNRSLEIQQFKEDLTSIGFTSWTNPSDYYGAQTVEFVQKFQTYYSINATGIADEATINQLNAVLNSPYQFGNSSPEIQSIKVKLSELGFTTWTNPNDHFGRETIEFVKDFQTHHGLVANGIVDSITYNKLQEEKIAPGDPTNESPDDTANDVEPDKSPVETLDVKKFKEDLTTLGFTTWTNPNSSYGPQTIRFVKDFQSYYGLPVNGQADDATLRQLEIVMNSPYRVGNSTSEIRDLKVKLTKLGFANWTNPNNNYGGETHRAVQHFQSHYGLVANGIADSVTHATIDAILNSPYQRGNSSSDIQKIKQDLTTLNFTPWNIPNNNFGPETEQYVKDFQRAMGLPISGIVDKITLARIAKALEDQTNRKPIIYLDPGHGSSDTGAYYYGVAEREINLQVSNKIASQLRNLGYEVVMSRTTRNNNYKTNSTQDLFARAAKANEIGADILVSVHHNAMPNSSAVTGIETFYYGSNSKYPPLKDNRYSHNDPKRLNDSLNVATKIHDELIKATGVNNRGIKRGAFIVLREAKMPAVLLELGFMSNRNELGKLTTNSYQNILADSVVRGINQYFGR